MIFDVLTLRYGDLDVESWRQSLVIICMGVGQGEKAAVGFQMIPGNCCALVQWYRWEPVG